MSRVFLVAVVTLCLALAGLPAGGAESPVVTPGGDPSGAYRILVFTKTAAFRHGSIPAGTTALQKLGAEHGFGVDATDDATIFTDAGLAPYAVVAFLSTDGEVLDDTQQGAFQRFIRAGGGYVGIHAASATEQTWPWYGELVGAYFKAHPAIQAATMNVDDRVHPSTAHLPARWQWTDEWYAHCTFNAEGACNTFNPRGRVHVLMTVDETTYAPGSNATHGIDHPIAWCHNFDGGRSWYTAIGHSDAHYSDPLYLGHLLGGIQSAAGVAEGDCGATIESNFVKVPIDTDTAKPIRLQAAPDGRIFYLEQAGQVKIYDPATNEITVAADFVRDRGIFNEFENGTVGVALDPDFTQNGWVYLYYSPRAEATLPQRTAGKFGNGVPLKGAGEYVELPSGIVSELNDFTISTWVNPTAVQTWQRVFDFGSDTTKNMFLTASAGQAPRFAITANGNAGGAERRLDAPAPLLAGQWTHLAVTLSGTTGTMYVNGLPVDVEPAMDIKPADLGITSRNWIGRSQYPDPYLNGVVDEFQIYDRALSATDVLSLTQSATGTAGGGNVLRYNFDEQTGETVSDVSGNGADGRVFASSAVACPPTEAQGAKCGEVLLSRFTLAGSTLDLSSEKVLLRVAHQRDTCCHTTGDLAFDSKGNLYLSTGDDTNPWESGGYAPIDERAGRNSRDAQRTSANTNDLRGKILRIHPEQDGTYTIPQGNLFPPGTDKTRPEIFAMGMRNPFTITVDPETDVLAVAEYGPDASIANPTRGPEGRVELNYMTEAGNYGWPYCIAENTPYKDYDFLTMLPSTDFNCAAPVNASPNNTGLRDLPPAKPSTLYQSISSVSPPRHTMGQGSAPMTGPFFEYDALVDAASDRALPAYYDGAQLYLDWNFGRLYEIRRDEGHTIRTINRFLPSTSLSTLRKPIEMVQAADGSLYVSEWGTEQFFGPNTDSGIYRIEYRG